MRVIALIDGEHHPRVVRDALARLGDEYDIARVLFVGGEEKVAAAVLDDPAAHYGHEVTRPGDDVRWTLAALAADAGADAVLDLSGDPVLDADARMELASVALDRGVGYRAPGLELRPPVAGGERPAVRTVAVIGTGKRTGKTALGTHLAGLLRARGDAPVVVSMGRGGPPEPVLVRADQRPDLGRLLEIARGGDHAASDYLEDAVLAGVTTVGCRRCGEGPAGETYDSNVVAGIGVALAERPDLIVLEGSGGALPPVPVHATVCVTAAGTAHRQALSGLGPLRLLRSDLLVVLGTGDLEHPARRSLEESLARWIRRDHVIHAALRPEPAEPIPPHARVACFVTAPKEALTRVRAALAQHGVDVILMSGNLARREALAEDVERARRDRCTVFLCELKAAAIDVVAEGAARLGAQVVFLRNRPVELAGEQPLDEALMGLAHPATAAEPR
jgi:cyclic 2,3-diphosphoglycerate synthetase